MIRINHGTNHYIRKDWPQRKNFIPGLKNIFDKPLVDAKRCLSSSISHQAGVYKITLKAVNKDDDSFKSRNTTWFGKFEDILFISPEHKHLKSV